MANRQRWDLCTARPKGGHSAQSGDVWWHRIGTAFENDKGQLVLFFDSLPVPDEGGKVSAMGFVPKPRDEQSQRGGGDRREAPAHAPAGRGKGRTLADDLDDEIPF